MDFIKRVIFFIVGADRVSNWIQLKLLVQNFCYDFKLFKKHSTVFKYDTLNKVESRLILDYHSIEKGMLHYSIKPRFAKERVINLLKFISEYDLTCSLDKSQIIIAFKVLCKYYELHLEMNINIQDYFSESKYFSIKEKLGKEYSNEFTSIVTYHKDILYKNNQENFEKFSNSRKSIRDFNGKSVDLKTIEKALKMAQNAPSVCNRQSSKVYLLENKNKIDDCLKVQGGFNGYIKNVLQLLILTVDRNYFYTVGERNQMYIDGGIYLLNLLYSLHFYGIASCPANWGKTIDEEIEFNKIVPLPENEKIICLIPIGVAKDKIRVTLSQRRNIEEIFKIIQ